VTEGDFLGLQYLYKAGYDPQAMGRLLQKTEAQAKPTSTLFATFPPVAERIKTVQDDIGTFLPQRAQHVVTTPEFERIKALLFGK
jgi:predicted Zn-dependent protease